MGFRYQRRINLGRGMGLNISKSGVSTSLRTRYGSIGSKGFSVRTGIRGVSYRGGYRKGSDGGLIVLLIFAAVALIPFLLQLAIVAARVLWAVTVLLAQILIVAGKLIGQRAQHVTNYIANRQALAGATPQPALGARFWLGIGSAVLITLIVASTIVVHKLKERSLAAQQAAQNQSLDENKSKADAADTVSRPEPLTASPAVRKRSHPRGQQADPPGGTAGARESDTATSQPAAAPDDLGEIRARDAQDGDHIFAYCAQATVTAADKIAATAACHRAEAAAWKRLTLGNELPTLDDATRQKCRQPPFPDSFVGMEACAKYLLNIN